ncbi:UNVERIFIED_ORG: hypothetical protein M2348_001646 [Sphingomonas sp. R1F5B]
MPDFPFAPDNSVHADQGQRAGLPVPPRDKPWFYRKSPWFPKRYGTAAARMRFQLGARLAVAKGG